MRAHVFSWCEARREARIQMVRSNIQPEVPPPPLQGFAGRDPAIAEWSPGACVIPSPHIHRPCSDGTEQGPPPAASSRCSAAAAEAYNSTRRTTKRSRSRGHDRLSRWNEPNADSVGPSRGDNKTSQQHINDVISCAVQPPPHMDTLDALQWEWREIRHFEKEVRYFGHTSFVEHDFEPFPAEQWIYCPACLGPTRPKRDGTHTFRCTNFHEVACPAACWEKARLVLLEMWKAANVSVDRMDVPFFNYAAIGRTIPHAKRVI